ncbi:fasciclin domain-containing protein [Flagellimonas meridianipacifica]|uniref:Putative surface protein with fasciclin (FAS1) repeats n=1 Tax=Flagellimonas meridianipacifica TaxID=1080225 RepID=A0A2T0MAP0_9FLAO|nr:fasciclin domain-containing protein [Allomuricauda pacifica]PRX54555.1 putative surface protein with fasciclin (FAS1) repeats [Allomuricauda pacifica]
MKSPIINYLLAFSFLFFVESFAQTKSIVSSAGASGNHSMLIAAVEATEIDEVLEKSGPFTVFAPSDAAFQRFSSDKLKQLMTSNDKSKLKSLVSYHIVAGKLTASRILKAMCRGNGKASFTTIQGKKLQAHMEGYDIVLTDPLGNTARIIQADVSQQNGIIHEIDSVIVPTSM